MWQKMSADELAAFERSQGEEIMQVNGVYWQRIRRFFYRPLLPFREYPASSQSFPPRAPFRGYQCAVPAHEPANSRLNVLLFTDPKSYTLESLERAKRKQVRASAKEFTIRRLEEVKEFSDKAHPVYLSFYERTRYGYKAERRDPRVFARWAESVYRFPQNLVLGAFKDTELHAVSISRLVEDTLVYSMVFCTELALRLNVTSALLHHLREAAAASPDIKQMFVGMYKYRGRTGIDDFYFARGCQLVSKPAIFRINPVAKICLRAFMRSEYHKLSGHLEAEVASLAVTGNAESAGALAPELPQLT